MDTNWKSIHNFIISTDVNCSKFVEQKNKRLNIYINKVILYNINKGNGAGEEWEKIIVMIIRNKN